MKILAEETVVRLHVEFDETETALLKAIGFLPAYAEPRARLWSTKVEMAKTAELLTQAREQLAASRDLRAAVKQESREPWRAVKKERREP